jgi:hypothetical protein
MAFRILSVHPKELEFHDININISYVSNELCVRVMTGDGRGDAMGAAVTIWPKFVRLYNRFLSQVGSFNPEKQDLMAAIGVFFGAFFGARDS